MRHRSVTVAAGELGVTQAAVSRQIALLEAEFGFPLFPRGHRSIEPTACQTALERDPGSARKRGSDAISMTIKALR